MQGLVGLDLRAGRGATMSRVRLEEAVGPEALPSPSGTSPSFDRTRREKGGNPCFLPDKICDTLRKSAVPSLFYG